MLTVVILTRDEQARLPSCLNAIPRLYPVVVVDSGSRDQTVELATQSGCRCLCNPWPGFSEQRNFALNSGVVTTPWTLFIDADEIFPPAFFAWAEQVLASAPVDVYQVPCLLFLDGAALRHAPGYPILHPRLVRTDICRFERNHAGHGEQVVAGLREAVAPIGYDHFFFNGDLVGWMHKHVGLARQEAVADIHVGRGRRGRLQRLVRHLPGKPVLRFLYHYLVCRGFLDGTAGLRYSAMYAWYEATKALLRGSAAGGDT